jgi:chaperonin GroES
MNIRPLSDRIIVRRVEEETTTASGLIIPGSATETPTQGEVVAAGLGKKNDQGEVTAMDVKVGDMVLFTQYAGTEIKNNNETLLVMSESDVMAIIE